MTLAKQLGLRGPKTAQTLGQHLHITEFDKFTDDQLNQLYELMLAATGQGKDLKDEK